MKNSEMSAAENKDGLLALAERLMRPFHKEGLRFVTKVVDPCGVDPDVTPHIFLDRIELFNALFPETAYELQGFGRDEGRFKVILRQPFIEGS